MKGRAVSNPPQEEAREQDHSCIRGERGGSAVAVRLQMQDEEAGDHGVLHADGADGDTRRNDRARQPSAGSRVRLGMVVLGHARQHQEGDDGGGHLHQSGVLERAEPLTHHRTRR